MAWYPSDGYNIETVRHIPIYSLIFSEISSFQGFYRKVTAYITREKCNRCCLDYWWTLTPAWNKYQSHNGMFPHLASAWRYYETNLHENMRKTFEPITWFSALQLQSENLLEITLLEGLEYIEHIFCLMYVWILAESRGGVSYKKNHVIPTIVLFPYF